MEKEIKDFTNQALKQKLWNVRRKIRSMLVFEVGEEVEKNRGEYHFWINCSHWWLQRGEGSDFVDIVNSESSQKVIDEKIEMLTGKKLLHIQYDSKTYSTIFDFENDYFLRVAPYGNGKQQEQWYVFKSEEVLKVDSLGQVIISEI